MKMRLLFGTLVTLSFIITSASAQPTSPASPVPESAILEGRWAEVCRIVPTDAPSQFLLNVCYGFTEQWDKSKDAKSASSLSGGENAIRSLVANFIKKHPDNAYAQSLNAILLRDTGQLDNALEEWQRVTTLKPTSAVPFYEMAVIYGDRGNDTKRLELLQKAIQADPNYGSSYWNMGNLLRKQNKYDEAAKAYQSGIKALSAKGVTTGYVVGQLYYNWAYILMNGPAPDTEKAFPLLEKAVAAYPRHYEANNELGIAYKRKGNYEKAIECYKRALEVNPKVPELWGNLGIAYARTGKKADARAAFKKILEIAPNGGAANLARQWLSQLE